MIENLTHVNALNLADKIASNIPESSLPAE